MESAILRSINIFTFEGYVAQKKNEQGEEYVLFTHSDGTETRVAKECSVDHSSSDESVQDNIANEERFECYWKNDVINVWEKKDELLWTLTITNKKHRVTSTIDSNLVLKLKQYSWTPWKSQPRPNQVDRETKYYLRHGNTKTLSHCCLHEYVLRLNNVEKPSDGKAYSVDHINRDTLDNRLENLRWATPSEQLMNTDKRERKHNARELPEGIEQKDLPKYVTYNKETYNKEKGLTRDFFRIEKHPTGKYWTSSKSNDISAQDKLAEAYRKLDELGDTFDHIPEFVKNSTRDPEWMAEDETLVLKRSMMPPHVNFVKETDKRGCKFEVTIPRKNRVCTSGSKRVTLKEKFEAMLRLREEAMA